MWKSAAICTQTDSEKENKPRAYSNDSSWGCAFLQRSPCDLNSALLLRTIRFGTMWVLLKNVDSHCLTTLSLPPWGLKLLNIFEATFQCQFILLCQLSQEVILSRSCLLYLHKLCLLLCSWPPQEHTMCTANVFRP